MSCPFEDLITTARSLKFRKQRDCGEIRTLINKGLDLAGMGVDINEPPINTNDSCFCLRGFQKPSNAFRQHASGCHLIVF